ncbi:DUF340 domain-containing protein [candidate division WWE3 bacterium]|nr:DUF340 domain-containing protein [candidate division WWE3 bacterium]
MLFISLSLIIGFTLGLVFRGRFSNLEFLEKVMDLLVLLLIFSIGMNLGSNTVLLENFSTLGFQSILLALFCSAGSVLLVFLFTLRRNKNV